jgi:hypothetical protein
MQLRRVGAAVALGPAVLAVEAPVVDDASGGPRDPGLFGAAFGARLRRRSADDRIGFRPCGGVLRRRRRRCAVDRPTLRRRPFLRDQDSGFEGRQIEGIAHLAPLQVDAVDLLSKLPHQTHAHSDRVQQCLCLARANRLWWSLISSPKGQVDCCRCARLPPAALLVRLKITRQPSGSIDGIQLDDFIVGFTYDVGTMLACYLLAERLAVPIADESPALVTSVETLVRFDVSRLPANGKVVPIRPQRFMSGLGARERAEAAERPRRRLRKRR